MGKVKIGYEDINPVNITININYYNNSVLYTTGSYVITQYTRRDVFNTGPGTPQSYGNYRTVYNSTNVVLSTYSTITGYNTYWNTNSTLTGTDYATGSTQSLSYYSTGLNLYINTKIKSYNLTWNYKGKGGTNSTTLTNYNTAITAPTPSGVTGYTFGGWSETDGGTIPSYSAGGSFNMPDSVLTYYAIWTVNRYTVTYNTNGGTTTASDTATYDANFTPPTITRTGYTFGGWYLNSDFTGTQYTGGTAFTWTFTANQTFYANWTANSYTLTWNANSIGTGKNQTIHFGASITAPTLKAVGYSLLGWNTSSTATTVGTVATTMPAGNTTYYAIWTNLNEVKFSHLQDTFGGSDSITISEYQSSISKSANSETSLSGDFKGKGLAP
jgi:uncharacterized repeat protein (TIGR02543 family)